MSKSSVMVGVSFGKISPQAAQRIFIAGKRDVGELIHIFEQLCLSAIELAIEAKNEIVKAAGYPADVISHVLQALERLQTRVVHRVFVVPTVASSPEIKKFRTTLEKLMDQGGAIPVSITFKQNALPSSKLFRKGSPIQLQVSDYDTVYTAMSRGKWDDTTRTYPAWIEVTIAAQIIKYSALLADCVETFEVRNT